MSILDINNSKKERDDELLYFVLEESLKAVLDKLKNRPCTFKTDTGEVYTVVISDDWKNSTIENTGKVVMQWLWRKLNMKIPPGTRQMLDKDFNLLDF